MPILADRINQLKHRYPFLQTGLNLYNNKLLQACKDYGPSVVSVVVEYMCAFNDDPENTGDVILHGHLLKLASAELKHPLLKLEGDIKELRSFTVKLTEAGKAVLMGEANFVELNGIDEWIGGVHLQSPGPVWFYNPEQAKLVLVG